MGQFGATDLVRQAVGQIEAGRRLALERGPLEACRRFRRLAPAVEALQREVVMTAREDGVSWDAIAAATGISARTLRRDYGTEDRVGDGVRVPVGAAGAGDAVPAQRAPGGIEQVRAMLAHFTAEGVDHGISL